MADDDPFYVPNRPPQPSRQSATEEPLFEFLLGHDRILCELFDLGEYGMNEEFWYSRRFDPRLDFEVASAGTRSTVGDRGTKSYRGVVCGELEVIS